ncbi:MAG: class B sortase [Candidatus Ornithomonoglobus sp.]
MKRIITLLQILFLCIFIGCGAYFGKLYYDKVQTEKEMEYLTGMIDDAPKESVEEENVEAEPEPETVSDAREANGMLSMYYKLYEQNNDMAGWVSINGTKINYPVLYSADSNAYYLHRNFEKQKSSPGMIFMDYQCDRNGKSINTILYGHNMRNGTMFHTLLNYEGKEFWKKYPLIAFDTMYDRGSYEIFAAFYTSVGSKNEFRYYDFIDPVSKEDFDSFIARCKSESIYDTGITPVYGERLLTLSTCSYNTSNERFVVVAVKR